MVLPAPSIAVVGAGIAGTAVARALAERGADVVVFAPEAPRASDVPVAVCQPVMGRRAGVSATRLRGFAAARALIGQAGDDDELVLARGLLRVATDERRAGDYERRGDDWPPEVARLLDANGCARLAPGLFGVRCGFWIPDAVAVSMPTLSARLGAGLPRVGARVRELDVDPGGATVVDERGGRARVDHVVLCAGIGSPALLAPWLPDAPFRSVLHGEIATLQAAAPAPIMVGETGQVVPLPGGGVALTASQRENGEPPAESGVATLRERAAALAPSLAGAAVRSVWSGRRLTTRDAHPLVGPVDDAGRVWTIAGLGSRGLLYGALAAQQVAAGLLEGAELEPLWAPRRTRGGAQKRPNPHSGG